MFKQHIKSAIRSFRKHQFYAIVNICGLAIGITTFVLIALYIHYHWSYDRYHENYKRIYRIDRIVQLADKEERGNETWYPISSELKKRFPEVEEALVMRYVGGQYLSATDEKTFFENDGSYAENSLFDIFSFEFIAGDPKTALADPFSIVLSEKMAEKYFPDESALGKIIKVKNQHELRVTGVYQNIPNNSELNDLEYVVPMKILNKSRGNTLETDWSFINFQSFILLRENTRMDPLEQKYTNLLGEFVEDTRDTICLTKLTDLHLYGNDEDKTYILLIVYGLLAIFSLIVACINFVNLATALSTTRAREIGIKKVVGSYRITLIQQFLTEAILITLLGLMLAFLLSWLILPVFSQVVREPLVFNLSDHWLLIFIITAIILVTGVFSGLYPAFLLSSFNAVKAIKNPFSLGGKRAGTRKILVGFQFVLTSMIIFSTIMLLGQLRFMKEKPRGYNSENVLTSVIQGENELTRKEFSTLTEEMKRVSGVQDITVSGYLPMHGYVSWPVTWEGSMPDEMINIRRNWVGFNYFSLYDIELIQGRYFYENPSEDARYCIINETAVQQLGWDDPIGKQIDDDKYTVIGVIKDYHVSTVFMPIPPCIFLPKKGSLEEHNVFSIKLNPGIDPGDMKESIASVFEKYVPDQIVEVKHYDEVTRDGNINVYLGIVKTFSFFAGVTILLSLFGLFGLVSFSLKRRTKEVGIRKSLGSRITEIFILLAKDYTLIILIGLVIGLPASLVFDSIDPAYYKPSINWFQMGLGFICIAAVAFASVAYHTFRASIVNPVKALRYE